VEAQEEEEIGKEFRNKTELSKKSEIREEPEGNRRLMKCSRLLMI
jgi:hypothetical protein